MAATETIMGDGKKRARDVIGGLAGEISTVDVIKARKAFVDYRSDGGELDFEDYVRQVWKQKK